MKYMLLVSLIFFCLSANAQSISNTTDKISSSVVYNDTSAINRDYLLELKKKFGKYKYYDPAYEKLVLPALSFFPQLTDYHIRFKVRNHGAPLSTRPSYGSMFRHARKREYMVFISSDTTTEWKAIQLNRVPIMAQIGIIGHELSHIIEFKEKTTLGLVGLGINHISTRYMNKFEFQADSICISHGMGEYLLRWATYTRQALGAPDPEQLNVKGEMYNYRERYMSPATVRRYMKEMETVK